MNDNIDRKQILMDIGSSTVKVYELKNKKVTPLLQRTIKFKEGFDPEGGLSEESKKELFELVEEVKETHENTPLLGKAEGPSQEGNLLLPDPKVKIFATALYRKFSPGARTRWIDEFFLRTGLYFNIIDHELESFYLETALVGKCKLGKPTLLINVGGGSTELMVMYGQEAIEKQNVDIGVGTILTEFKGINDQLSKHQIEKVVDFVKKQLPSLENKPKIAFYSGGELTYMQRANYPLKKNTLFEDEDHPSMIDCVDFRAKNRAVFDTITIEQLESMMPENPKWMHGARACSALTQAICEFYGVKTLIPSDANLINGVVRQEFRYVTLSGSFRKHLKYIIEVKKRLEESGTRVLSPRFTEPKNPGEEFVVFSGEEGMTPLELERHHLDAIAKSDALIVCCPNGYVGASAMLEIGYANALNKRIIFTEHPEEFMLNTLPREVGL